MFNEISLSPLIASENTLVSIIEQDQLGKCSRLDLIRVDLDVNPNVTVMLLLLRLSVRTYIFITKKVTVPETERRFYPNNKPWLKTRMLAIENNDVQEKRIIQREIIDSHCNTVSCSVV